MSQKYAQTWELNSIFDGGSAAPEFMRELDRLAAEIPALKTKFQESGEEEKREREWIILWKLHKIWRKG